MKIEFKIKCKLCGNKKDNYFYFMPVDVKTKDGIVASPNIFKVKCKKCGQDYVLKLSMRSK